MEKNQTIKMYKDENNLNLENNEEILNINQKVD